MAAKIIKFPMTPRRQHKISQYIDHLLATSLDVVDFTVPGQHPDQSQSEMKERYSFFGPLPTQLQDP